MKIYSILGLIYMILILPVIPATIIWYYFSPATIGGAILTGLISTGVYILCLFAEIFVVLKVFE